MVFLGRRLLWYVALLLALEIKSVLTKPRSESQQLHHPDRNRLFRW